MGILAKNSFTEIPTSSEFPSNSPYIQNFPPRLFSRTFLSHPLPSLLSILITFSPDWFLNVTATGNDNPIPSVIFFNSVHSA